MVESIDKNENCSGKVSKVSHLELDSNICRIEPLSDNTQDVYVAASYHFHKKDDLEAID